MNQRLRIFGGCAVVLGLYALATLPILRSFPPVWPDEVLYYVPVASLVRGQGFGTSVLDGFLPGIGRYTFWHFPGYPFFLFPLLRFLAPSHHFIAMRLSSWLLGAIVLMLGAYLLKQLAAGWMGPLLGLVILGTEVGFMQAANVGRMEMLTLAWTLAALNAYVAWRGKRQRRLVALAGLFAGLALICHPAGILAGFVIVLHELTGRYKPQGFVPPEPAQPRSGWKDAAVFAGFAAAPGVPWLIYILQAPGLFLAQMAAQSTQKSLYLGHLLTRGGIGYWLMFPFWNAARPLGAQGLGVWPFHVGSATIVPLLLAGVGLAGLVAERRRKLEASILGGWVVAAYAFNLFMVEYWYAVYLLTPSCLLLGWVLSESSRRWMRAVALATLIAAAGWNFAEDKLMWWDCRDGWQAYQFYCLSLSRLIPAHSTILLAAIPDPYFGLLAQNQSYRFYEFVPVGVTVDEVQAKRVLDQVDYVVGSDCCRPDYLADYLIAHGKPVVNLGRRDFLMPPVVVWKLSGRTDASAAVDEKATPVE